MAGTKLAELPVTVESPEASELQLQMDGNGNAMKDKAKADRYGGCKKKTIQTCPM